MKKILFSLLIGFIVGAILCGAFFYCLKPRPGPAPDPVVTVNPTPEIKKQAEKVEVIKHEFTIKQPDKIPPKVKEIIPVKVTVKDEKSGEIQEAETVAEVEKTEDGDLTVALSDEIAIDIPAPKVKTWTIGAYYSDDGPGAFIQKDIKLITVKNIDVMAYGRVEFDKDVEYQIGVQVKF